MKSLLSNLPAVLAPGHVLFVFLAMLLAAGCAGGRYLEDDPSRLVGPTWRLVAFGEAAGLRPTLGDAEVTIAFTADGRLAGTAGCNRYFGNYEARGEALAISQVGATRMACPPPAMEVERAYLAALDAVRAWERDTRAGQAPDALELEDAGGETLLRFVATSAGAQAGAERAALTGTVTYLPRIALPPNATVTVRLLDVSRADAPSVTLAQETIATGGRQVPIPFSLDYDPRAIEANRRYVVRAEIRDGAGVLRWTTDTAYLVLTNGAPSSGVEVRLVQVTDGATGALLGPTWELVRIEPARGAALPIERDAPYRLTFGSDGRYNGQADCNRYGGEFEAELDGELSLERGFATLAACPSPSASGAFFEVLQEVERYTLSDDRLTLSGDAGALVFVRGVDFGGMPPQEPGRDYTYQCDGTDGPFTFRIRTGPGEVALWLPERFAGRQGGTYLVLGQVVSASGAKYQDGPVMVWTKGQREAILEVDGETFLGCAAASE